MVSSGRFLRNLGLRLKGFSGVFTDVQSLVGHEFVALSGIAVTEKDTRVRRKIRNTNFKVDVILIMELSRKRVERKNASFVVIERRVKILQKAEVKGYFSSNKKMKKFNAVEFPREL